MDKKIIIIGAGGHGKVVADIAKLNGYKEIVFLDDDTSKQTNGNYKIIGTTQDIEKYKGAYDFFVAIGNNKIREKLTNELRKMNITQTVLIHPTAVIDETVLLEEGIVVMANAVVNADTRLSRGVIINTSATVDHDCIINEFTHICPGVHIAGTVNIGKGVWVGIGSTLINNIDICDEVIIGAGSVVIKKIEEKGTYVGNPVRRISK